MPNPIIYLISSLIHLYSFVLVVWIIITWLIAFNIINAYQPFVYKVNEVLTRLCEPSLRWVRRYIPAIGGVDISPIVLLIGLNFLDYALLYYFG